MNFDDDEFDEAIIDDTYDSQVMPSESGDHITSTSCNGAVLDPRSQASTSATTLTALSKRIVDGEDTGCRRRML